MVKLLAKYRKAVKFKFLRRGGGAERLTSWQKLITAKKVPAVLRAPEAGHSKHSCIYHVCGTTLSASKDFAFTPPTGTLQSRVQVPPTGMPRCSGTEYTRAKTLSSLCATIHVSSA
jgi:hypothetical protein